MDDIQEEYYQITQKIREKCKEENWSCLKFCEEYKAALLKDHSAIKVFMDAIALRNMRIKSQDTPLDRFVGSKIFDRNVLKIIKEFCPEKEAQEEWFAKEE